MLMHDYIKIIITVTFTAWPWVDIFIPQDISEIHTKVVGEIFIQGKFSAYM